MGKPRFPSLLAVLHHLKGAGYKISQSKLYRDKDKNFITVEPDGTVLEINVREYAATLERTAGNLDDLNDVHIRKASKDVELREIKIKKMKFEYERERGKYIPRAQFEQELAARAGVFDAGFRHLFNMKVKEWIAVVGGKPEKSADLLALLNTALDELLTTYATIKVFQVMFSNKED